MRYGIPNSRRGWLRAADVTNATQLKRCDHVILEGACIKPILIFTVNGLSNASLKEQLAAKVVAFMSTISIDAFPLLMTISATLLVHHADLTLKGDLDECQGLFKIDWPWQDRELG